MNYQEFLHRYPHDPRNPLRFGGQGAVYQAVDVQTGGSVAIKRAQAMEGEKGEKYSVYKEFILGKSLQHPNLATYHDAFRLDTGMGIFDFGVMEFVEGGINLDDFMKSFPAEESIKLVLTGLLNGLKYLHQQGVIHRDLKPNNILIDYSKGTPTAKIIDFGVSKSLTSADTVASAIVGTFEYMSPEQINPPPGQKMLQNLDLWSFGVIVYRLFTGEMPFGSVEDGNTREEIQNRVLDAKLPSDVQFIPDPYRTIIERCLIRDVNRRIGTVDEVVALLQQPTQASPEVLSTNEVKVALDETSFSSSPVRQSPVDNKSNPRKSTRRLSVGLMLVGAVLLAGGFFGFRYWQKYSVQRQINQANELYLSSDYIDAFNILDKVKDSPYFSGHGNYVLGELVYHAYSPINKDLEAAAKYFQKAVDDGIAEGYIHLADMYKAGVIFSKDTAIAQEFYDRSRSLLQKEDADRVTAIAALGDLYNNVDAEEGKNDEFEEGKKAARQKYLEAANKGFTYAMYQLGYLCQQGEGGLKDSVAAFDWYTKAAEKGDPMGMAFLGDACLYGVGTTANPFKAVSWYEKSAEENNFKGQYELAHCYLYGTGGLVIDEKKAMDYFGKAADQEYEPAYHMIGWMYHEGLGVKSDQTEAAKWFEKAAKKNYATSQLQLAMYYEKGTGGKVKNTRKAFELCQQAAKSKYAPAQFLLGDYYRQGTGTSRSPKKAFELYKLAAEGNYLNAQNGLGYLYDQGLGTAEDDKEAVKWYKKAAYSGHPTGQYNLGFMFEFGNGIAVNLDSAYYWYRTAEGNGMPDGREGALRVEVKKMF